MSKPDTSKNLKMHQKPRGLNHLQTTVGHLPVESQRGLLRRISYQLQCRSSDNRNPKLTLAEYLLRGLTCEEEICRRVIQSSRHDGTTPQRDTVSSNRKPPRNSGQGTNTKTHLAATVRRDAERHKCRPRPWTIRSSQRRTQKYLKILVRHKPSTTDLHHVTNVIGRRISVCLKVTASRQSLWERGQHRHTDCCDD